MSEWKFRRRQGWCSTCEGRFPEGERHVSCLWIRGEEISREDACITCWERLSATYAGHLSSPPASAPSVPLDASSSTGQAPSPSAGDTALFYWFTRHFQGKKRLQLDLGTLEQLFLQLETRTEPRVRELRYVLCLLLMRKRRLKIDRVLRATEAEGESMIVHRPRRKEVLRVFVYDFAAERLAELRRDLLAVFEGAEPRVDAEPAGADPQAPSIDGSEPSPDGITEASPAVLVAAGVLA